MKEHYIFTVSQLTNYLYTVLEEDEILQLTGVSGEISNLTFSTAGHGYFTLKDNFSQLKCVIFRDAQRCVQWKMENGQQVIVFGKVTIYPKTSQYQLHVFQIEPIGVGGLRLAFLQLKEKLASEGLFDEDRKKPLPLYPQCVGIITSPTGAALQDILNIAKRRSPATGIIIFPSLVQGEEAPANLLKALHMVNLHKALLDVLIIARGGGSEEDLQAFNDEKIARFVYNLSLPVVSGVGHETDYMILDFVADCRAPTPSAAAELVFPDVKALKEKVYFLQERLIEEMEDRLAFSRSQLAEILSSRGLYRFLDHLRQAKQNIDDLSRRAKNSLENRLSSSKSSLLVLQEKLTLLNPENALLRGYALLRKKGKIFSRAENFKEGDYLDVVMADGLLHCLVKDVIIGNRE